MRCTCASDDNGEPRPITCPVHTIHTSGPNWVTRDGTKMPLSQMEYTHLLNSVAMLERGIERRKNTIALLKSEIARRDQITHEEWKKSRRMSSLATDKPRLIREDE